MVKLPPADVLAQLQQSWYKVRKPVRVLLVVDVSGSMDGTVGNTGKTKLDLVKAALSVAIDQVGSADEVGLWSFSNQYTEVVPIGSVGDQRDRLKAAIMSLRAGGSTALHRSTLAGLTYSAQHQDPGHISAMVVLTDGDDTVGGLDELLSAEAAQKIDAATRLSSSRSSLPCCRTSEMTSTIRAITDRWGLGIGAASAVAVLALGWGLPLAAGAFLAVIGVRVLAEHLVPRPHELEVSYAAQEQEAAVRAALDRAISSVRGRVSAEVETRVEGIRRTVLDVLGRTDSAHSRELFTALRTATDYLPAALDAYLRLPSTYATERRLEGGRTALEVLVDQLDLLQREMVGVADAVSRNDVDRLLAHGRFLADRFGRSELNLE